MDEWIDKWMDGWIDGWRDGWMDFGEILLPSVSAYEHMAAHAHSLTNMFALVCDDSMSIGIKP